MTFIGLFLALKELSLHFYPGNNYRRLVTLSTSLRLPCLRVLLITATKCTKDDLATLFLNYKDTLREIYLDCVNIIKEKGSWTSLELMVKEQLSVKNFSRPFKSSLR